jgi:hypothetical protein
LWSVIFDSSFCSEKKGRVKLELSRSLAIFTDGG